MNEVVEDFIKPTFVDFFSHEEIADIRNNASTVSYWDFNTALGDTIMEKYESLYVKMVEITNVLLAKGAIGYFWIATSPEIASIFETATAGFNPMGSSHREMIGGIYPLGLPEVYYAGAINCKWRLYIDSQLDKNVAIIGCNDKREPNQHYAKLTVCNFVI